MSTGGSPAHAGSASGDHSAISAMARSAVVKALTAGRIVVRPAPTGAKNASDTSSIKRK